MNIVKGQFINEHGIDCLKNYKYKSGSYTFMDNAMQPWWEFFVSCVPMVSCIGFWKESDCFYASG